MMNAAMTPDLMEKFLTIGALMTMIAIGSWVAVSWLRMKHGYPLDGAWGQAVYPKNNDETVERVKLLSQENAQLRAELGAVKDRLVNVERIVTDRSHLLATEIDSLRGQAN